MTTATDNAPTGAPEPNLGDILFAMTENCNRATRVAEGFEPSEETLKRYVVDGLLLAEQIERFAERHGLDVSEDGNLASHLYGRCAETTLSILRPLKRLQGLPEE